MENRVQNAVALKIDETVKENTQDILEAVIGWDSFSDLCEDISAAIAVAADTKSTDSNKIELRHSKSSGDITIPTRGIFLSTNCVEAIKNSIDAAGEDEEEPEAENADDDR